MTKCGLASFLLKAETQTQISIKGPRKLVEVNYEDPEEPMAPQQRGTSVTEPVSHLCWLTTGPMNPILTSLPILEGLFHDFINFAFLQINSVLKPMSDLRALNLHPLFPRLSSEA